MKIVLSVLLFASVGGIAHGADAVATAKDPKRAASSLAETVIPPIPPTPKCEFPGGKITLGADETEAIWNIAFGDQGRVSLAQWRALAVQTQIDISAQCVIQKDDVARRR